MRIKYDAAELAVMQVEYEDGPLTVDAIGERHGCSGQTVCKIAKHCGWRMRRQSAAAVAARPPAIADPGIGERLCNVIKKRLDQMEKDMDRGKLNSCDLERNAKAIASMISNIPRVAVPAPDEDKETKPDVAHAAASNDVERLQREIVERFERIQRRRQAERGPE